MGKMLYKKLYPVLQYGRYTLNSILMRFIKIVLIQLTVTRPNYYLYSTIALIIQVRF